MIVRNCCLRNPQKIMVRSTNWIGDAVMGLPALEALRERFPETEIVLVSKPWMSEVYKNHPAVDRQILYDPDGEHAGRRGFSKFIDRLKGEDFDGAVLFQNAFHAAWMAWRARIPVRLGYARDGRSALLTEAIETPPPAAYGHQSYYYLHLLFRAGLIEQPETPRPLTETWLAVDGAERIWAKRELESLGLHGPRFLVGIAPGAAFGPAKRWPVERFAALADRLVTALNADILIFGSRAEKQSADEIARQMEHTPSVLAGETTMRQSMALLECCRLVVTNDSGLMHIASALGLPVVATFGSTDERATGPLGPHPRIAKHRTACSPCGLRSCPIDFRCMEGLSVANVYRATLELVKQLGITHDRPAQQKGSR